MNSKTTTVMVHASMSLLTSPGFTVIYKVSGSPIHNHSSRAIIYILHTSTALLYSHPYSKSILGYIRNIRLFGTLDPPIGWTPYHWSKAACNVCFTVSQCLSELPAGCDIMSDIAAWPVLYSLDEQSVQVSDIMIKASTGGEKRGIFTELF